MQKAKRLQNHAGSHFARRLTDILGAVKKTLICALAGFKDEKLIDTRGSNITILNLEKLKKMRN